MTRPAKTYSAQSHPPAQKRHPLFRGAFLLSLATCATTLFAQNPQHPAPPHPAPQRPAPQRPQAAPQQPQPQRPQVPPQRTQPQQGQVQQGQVQPGQVQPYNPSLGSRRSVAPPASPAAPIQRGGTRRPESGPRVAPSTQRGGPDPRSQQAARTPTAPRIPPGIRRPTPGGGAQIQNAHGTYHVGEDQQIHSFTAPNGNSAHWNDSGHISQARVTRNGATTTVTHNPTGGHVITTSRLDGSQVVSTGPHSGWVQQPMRGRANFYSRTVVAPNGATHTAVYHSYQAVDGRTYYRYVPSVYYRPAFYTWAAKPWHARVTYSWAAAPTWGPVYGAYFTPYPSYGSATLWLTDYLLYTNLQAAYSERQAAAADPTYYQGDPEQAPAAYGQQPGYPQQTSPSLQQSPTELPSDVKNNLAKQAGDYVARMQLVSETTTPTAAATIPVALSDNTPGALDPKIIAFQISTDTQLQVSEDQTCALTPGDVLYRGSTTPDSNGRLPVKVVGTKPGDCSMNTLATITVAELDEINNQSEQQMDQGLAEAARHNGVLPPPPSGSTGATQLAAAQPDPNTGALLAPKRTNRPAGGKRGRRRKPDPAPLAHVHVTSS